MSMVDKIRSGIAVMKPAAPVCVALFQQDDGSKTVWGIVHTDHDGASDVVDCGYSDLGTDPSRGTGVRRSPRCRRPHRGATMSATWRQWLDQARITDDPAGDFLCDARSDKQMPDVM